MKWCPLEIASEKPVRLEEPLCAHLLGEVAGENDDVMTLTIRITVALKGDRCYLCDQNYLWISILVAIILNPGCSPATSLFAAKPAKPRAR